MPKIVKSSGEAIQITREDFLRNLQSAGITPQYLSHKLAELLEAKSEKVRLQTLELIIKHIIGFKKGDGVNINIAQVWSTLEDLGKRAEDRISPVREYQYREDLTEDG